jgi:hypothetical protein
MSFAVRFGDASAPLPEPLQEGFFMGTRWLLFLASTLLVAAGCGDDPASVRDRQPPAAPRGLFSVTGDEEVFLHWLENTEADVAAYRVYEAPCAGGSSCLYEEIGATTGTSFRVGGLDNGETRFFAVAALDHAGNESELSEEFVFDTPRPEGTDRSLDNYLESNASGGYDFSAFAVRAADDPLTDMFFGYDGDVYQMFVPDLQTDIQDAGYAEDLDVVDFAPTSGWSPSGSVELIVGHCYIVWTRDDHYAKFRVTEIRPAETGVPAQVVFDWAYQVDPGNRELRAGRVKDGHRGATRPIAWIR